MTKTFLANALVGLAAFSGLVTCSPTPSKEDKTPKPNWYDCPASLSTELKCLDVTVPLDYDDPDGETINITAVKMITNSTDKIGSAVFQWGGPGFPVAVTVAQDLNGTAESFFQFKDRFDIVAVDPRGVGINHPVKCDPKHGKENWFDAAYPNNEKEFNDGLAFFKELGESCANRTGKVIHHLDTVTQAKDLESVRVAMGVADHTISSFDFTSTEITGTANDMSRMLDWAAHNESSPLKGQDVRGMLREIVAKADETPIRMPGCEKSGTCQAEVNGNTFRGTIVAFLDHPLGISGGFPLCARSIQEAYEGNYTMWATLNPTRPYEWDPSYSELGIICQDFDFDEDWERFQQTQMTTAALSPDMEGCDATRIWSMGCKGWPTKVTNPPHDYKITNTSAPILLVHALWDSSTPYQWAVRVNRKIEGSVLLTREGEGHGSLAFDSTRKAMFDYLVDPVKNLPKPLTVINEAVAHNETDGFSTRPLALNPPDFDAA
ncbi:hypothetical protein H2204_004906 [Knufia peltigerae]|uniref:Peptidase S33 tripeptidyl aminopeptidase-like C-terminal domain-containing protein n=1 Tax=Knufia peltigerae TaxID=1002370 RepID=A0AA38Y6W7_9EURO|nr:hypothetical protein H2204_004906 [Knufia peltigerae]